LSKNYRASINRFQEEQFRPAVCSYDPDVILTWMMLDAHYPPELKDTGHLFLSPIDDSLTPIWFKVKQDENGKVVEGVNLGINQIRKFLKCMSTEAGVKGNVMNKSGRVTGITRMAVAGVPRHVMAELTSHRSLSSLDKYDASKDLDKAAAHLALRMPYDTSDPNNIQHLKFDQLKEAVTLEYHKTQIGGFGTSASNLVESSSIGAARISPLASNSPIAQLASSSQCLSIIPAVGGGFEYEHIVVSNICC
jgi:hypothetical protein